MANVPLYVTIEDVRPYLLGKVTFSDDINTGITDEFFNTLCWRAESFVLQDLNHFYEVPLVSDTTGNYDDLPSYSQGLITNLIISKCSVQTILFDFGRKSPNISDDYKKSINAIYVDELNKIYSKDPKTGMYRLTPIPDLRINKYATNRWTYYPLPKSTNNIHGLKNNLDIAIEQTVNPAINLINYGASGVQSESNESNQ